MGERLVPLYLLLLRPFHPRIAQGGRTSAANNATGARLTVRFESTVEP